MPKLRGIRLVATFLCAFTLLAFIFLANINTTRNPRDGKGQKDSLPQENSLLDIPDFRYLLNKTCAMTRIDLLIIIHSAPQHTEHRDLIRSTWGNASTKDFQIKAIFLLAASETFQKDIEREDSLHRDIVQGSFVDSYRNLTYKHVMGLRWVADHCPQAQVVLKMDDDIFVEIFQLQEFVQERLAQDLDLGNSIGCYFQNRMPVVRDPVSKWYVSKTEYPSDNFDNYCSGWAYMTTPRVAALLTAAAADLPYFWVDDVHVTGTVAAAAGVGHLRWNRLFALEVDGLMEWSFSGEDIRWAEMFAPTWGDLALAKRAHEKAYQCHLANCKCCYRRTTTPAPIVTSTTVRGVAKLLSNGLAQMKQQLQTSGATPNSHSSVSGQSYSSHSRSLHSTSLSSSTEALVAIGTETNVINPRKSKHIIRCSRSH